MSEVLRQSWSRSRAFRVVLIVALVYALLRLSVHGVYLAMMLSPGQGEGRELPGAVGAEEPMVPVDLQIYIDAASRLQNRQDLYPTPDRIEVYQYPPSYALAFTPFLRLSPVAIVIVHTLLHIAAYGLLYWLWARIFHRLGLDRANQTLAWILPVWLVFSAFWSDLGYLNIYIIVALLATLLISAVLEERLGWSLLWLSIILQVKPHWAFAAAVPLLLGRRRFFLKLVGAGIVSCAAITGATIWILGLSYGWQQYVDFAQLMWDMRQYFPWRGPDAGFLGYNHSIAQIVVYLLGVSSSALRLATGVKALLLIPLAVVSLRHLRRPANAADPTVSQLGLDFAFALYLGAFIWLDMVWELSLGIAVFPYLLATLKQRSAKTMVWAVFLPYALVDLWQLVSFALFGIDVIAPGPYVLTDPSIYVPLVMIVTVTFYALLVRRLWNAAPARRAVGELGWILRRF